MQRHLPRHLTLLSAFFLQIMALIVSVAPGHTATAAQRTQAQSSPSLASSEDFLSDKKASSCAVMDSAYGTTVNPAYNYWYPVAPASWPVTYLKNHNSPGVLVGDYLNARIRLRHTTGSG